MRPLRIWLVRGIRYAKVSQSFDGGGVRKEVDEKFLLVHGFEDMVARLSSGRPTVRGMRYWSVANKVTRAILENMLKAESSIVGLTPESDVKQRRSSRLSSIG